METGRWQKQIVPNLKLSRHFNGDTPMESTVISPADWLRATFCSHISLPQPFDMKSVFARQIANEP